MENIIETLFTDPTAMKVGIVLVILITLSLFKKLFKIVFILLVVLLGYAAYLVTTGEDPADIIKDTIENAQDIDLDDLKDKAEDAVKNVQKKVKKNFK
ncbi:MAG: hypothetical protein H8E71_06830 [Candidatus Marinimicrobia bacterium]|nr:hypothetical protein [Candidatus Neomarinimicrobiota bacterium]MBL7109333.1 hypothetical protein [Candidatus Neomarinimicrobiota bacterium]